ncbi:hypothetical protein NCU08545 [Neurospora crassa OR74A]|uniref:Uncharacterized protein n=1 Tax=Neurospora crassa (strain ATCC 24698 / 74-OR23-1A / CBS 708.71 / DSM 1257 / FGSC 987) TaxID=367110 RepID=Q7SBK5_NEUCR|nr:hypothetical protein NCU08545 [Neurospora crassa OR74A]EAA33791.2 hypothetical protein NCU08545 [Neurospora crassa OR74A]|eukprot:XP_963027.2 hypothetical protein NCU08545 [Neurospora crassa OR74A]
MGRGGGLVFTGMPRRREVLGTGIIRWEKVINPDGSVTWQEAQPTTASVNSKKEEKGTKAEKQKLERPSWIETKKEATTTNTKRPAKEVEDLTAQKEPKVEAARPRRAFSFHQTEEKKTERAEKTTTHVEEIRFSAPIRKDDEKKGGFVAGLATKFGSTKKAEDMPNPKKDVPLQVEIQPTSASTSTHHTFLHLPTEEKLNTPPPPLSPPTTQEKKINPIADDYFSHSHWSIRDDSKQESDAELAQRLANTEKIFRQQEQKIQAALDRIRDLERQLASGFTTATATGEKDDDEEVQTETGTTKTWDNESIAAGGRESGPHFRQLQHGNSSSKGPLPCFSGDEPPFHYRVLTVNSHKPQVINNNNMNVREQRHHLHHEDIVIDNSDSDDNNSRTPSPIAVTFNIPAPPPPKPAAASLNPPPPPSKRQQQLPTKTAFSLDPITKSPQSFVLQSLKHEPTPSSSAIPLITFITFFFIHIIPHNPYIPPNTDITITNNNNPHQTLLLHPPLSSSSSISSKLKRQQTPKQTNLPPLRLQL